MSDNANTSADKWSQLVAQCWMDKDYQGQLIQNPEAVLKEAGFVFPSGVKPRVIVDGAGEQTLVIPPPPVTDDFQMTLESRKVAGSASCCMASCVVP